MGDVAVCTFQLQVWMAKVPHPPTPCSCAVIIILLRGMEDRGVETPPGYRENHVPHHLPALRYTCAYIQEAISSIATYSDQTSNGPDE